MMPTGMVSLIGLMVPVLGGVRRWMRSPFLCMECEQFGVVNLDMTWYGYGLIPINTIFSGMNIHKSQIFWCSPGVPGFWLIATWYDMDHKKFIHVHSNPPRTCGWIRPFGKMTKLAQHPLVIQQEVWRMQRLRRMPRPLRTTACS